MSSANNNSRRHKKEVSEQAEFDIAEASLFEDSQSSSPRGFDEEAFAQSENQLLQQSPYYQKLQAERLAQVTAADSAVGASRAAREPAAEASAQDQSAHASQAKKTGEKTAEKSAETPAEKPAANQASSASSEHDGYDSEFARAAAAAKANVAKQQALADLDASRRAQKHQLADEDAAADVKSAQEQAAIAAKRAVAQKQALNAEKYDAYFDKFSDERFIEMQAKKSAKHPKLNDAKYDANFKAGKLNDLSDRFNDSTYPSGPYKAYDDYGQPYGFDEGYRELYSNSPYAEGPYEKPYGEKEQKGFDEAQFQAVLAAERRGFADADADLAQFANRFPVAKATRQRTRKKLNDDEVARALGRPEDARGKARYDEKDLKEFKDFTDAQKSAQQEAAEKAQAAVANQSTFREPGVREPAARDLTLPRERDANLARDLAPQREAYPYGYAPTREPLPRDLTGREAREPRTKYRREAYREPYAHEPYASEPYANEPYAYGRDYDPYYGRDLAREPATREPKPRDITAAATREPLARDKKADARKLRGQGEDYYSEDFGPYAQPYGYNEPYNRYDQAYGADFADYGKDFGYNEPYAAYDQAYEQAFEGGNRFGEPGYQGQHDAEARYEELYEQYGYRNRRREPYAGYQGKGYYSPAGHTSSGQGSAHPAGPYAQGSAAQHQGQHGQAYPGQAGTATARKPADSARSFNNAQATPGSVHFVHTTHDDALANAVPRTRSDEPYSPYVQDRFNDGYDDSYDERYDSRYGRHPAAQYYDKAEYGTAKEAMSAYHKQKDYKYGRGQSEDSAEQALKDSHKRRRQEKLVIPEVAVANQAPVTSKAAIDASAKDYFDSDFAMLTSTKATIRNASISDADLQTIDQVRQRALAERPVQAIVDPSDDPGLPDATKIPARMGTLSGRRKQKSQQSEKRLQQLQAHQAALPKEFEELLRKHEILSSIDFKSLPELKNHYEQAGKAGFRMGDQLQARMPGRGADKFSRALEEVTQAALNQPGQNGFNEAAFNEIDRKYKELSAEVAKSNYAKEDLYNDYGLVDEFNRNRIKPSGEKQPNTVQLFDNLLESRRGRSKTSLRRRRPQPEERGTQIGDVFISNEEARAYQAANYVRRVEAARSGRVVDDFDGNEYESNIRQEQIRKNMLTSLSDSEKSLWSEVSADKEAVENYFKTEELAPTLTQPIGERPFGNATSNIRRRSVTNARTANRLALQKAEKPKPLTSKAEFNDRSYTEDAGLFGNIRSFSLTDDAGESALKQAQSNFLRFSRYRDGDTFDWRESAYASTGEDWQAPLFSSVRVPPAAFDPCLNSRSWLEDQAEPEQPENRDRELQNFYRLNGYLPNEITVAKVPSQPAAVYKEKESKKNQTVDLELKRLEQSDELDEIKSELSEEDKLRDLKAIIEAQDALTKRYEQARTLEVKNDAYMVAACNLFHTTHKYTRSLRDHSEVYLLQMTKDQVVRSRVLTLMRFFCDVPDFEPTILSENVFSRLVRAELILYPWDMFKLFFLDESMAWKQKHGIEDSTVRSIREDLTRWIDAVFGSQLISCLIDEIEPKQAQKIWKFFNYSWDKLLTAIYSVETDADFVKLLASYHFPESLASLLYNYFSTELNLAHLLVLLSYGVGTANRPVTVSAKAASGSFERMLKTTSAADYEAWVKKRGIVMVKSRQDARFSAYQKAIYTLASTNPRQTNLPKEQKDLIKFYNDLVVDIGAESDVEQLRRQLLITQQIVSDDEHVLETASIRRELAEQYDLNSLLEEAKQAQASIETEEGEAGAEGQTEGTDAAADQAGADGKTAPSATGLSDNGDFGDGTGGAVEVTVDFGDNLDDVDLNFDESELAFDEVNVEAAVARAPVEAVEPVAPPKRRRKSGKKNKKEQLLPLEDVFELIEAHHNVEGIEAEHFRGTKYWIFGKHPTIDKKVLEATLHELGAQKITQSDDLRALRFVFVLDITEQQYELVQNVLTHSPNAAAFTRVDLDDVITPALIKEMTDIEVPGYDPNPTIEPV